MDIFVVFQANYTIIFESIQIRRTRAELEAVRTNQKAIGAKYRNESEHCRDFAVLRIFATCIIFQVAKFRNFAGYEI